MKREFAREGLGYVLRIQAIATELSVDRLVTTRGELHGELRVVCGMAMTKSLDGHLHQARFNLSSTSARTTTAKVLQGRANAPDIDWLDLLEELCRLVLDAERTGSPVELVGALPIDLRETYRLDPMLPEGQATWLYGDGGTGKSTIAAAMAVSCETGAVVVDGWTPRRAPTLYLDWEAGRRSINRRVRGVAIAAHIPSVVTIRYLDCRRRGPLRTFAEEVARIVDVEGIGLVVVDSVGLAAGTTGEGDANETTLRLFEAFGFIGTTILAIDHVSAADRADPNKPAKPYGSIYKLNLARAAFELRRSKLPDGSSAVGLYQTKANDQDPLDPVALILEYGADGSIAYRRRADLPLELTGPLRHADRIAAVMAAEHMTTDEIADASGIAEHVVRTTLNRHKTRFGRLPSGKWELLDHAS